MIVLALATLVAFFAVCAIFAIRARQPRFQRRRGAIPTPPGGDPPPDPATPNSPRPAEPTSPAPPLPRLILAPAIWPGKPLAIQPGDLTQFSPMGMNFDAPLIVRPGDSFASAMNARNFYRTQSRAGSPFADAPATDPAGGTVYLDDDTPVDELRVLFLILGIMDAQRTFAAFEAESVAPATDRYLKQLRIVGSDALPGLFEAEPRAELIAQPFGIGTAIERFIASERERWGHGMSSQLRGTFGGDGDWAKESLCFGLMVENAYYGIYRVWSRAWLVTK